MDANRIRELRQAKGMDPVELAYRIRRSQTTVWRYEMGEAEPSLRTAKRIAQVLDSTLDEVFPTLVEEPA